MSKIIEKEVKYCITNPMELIDKLKNSKEGTYIRLRTGFKNTLTLKKARVKESEVSERLEIEIEIDDMESCQKLLQEIGLNEKLIMEKYRMIWEVNGTIITIDELPFGVYVEIEGSVQSIKILSELLGLNYDNRIIITYWEIYKDIMESMQMVNYDPNILFPNDYVSKLLAN